VINWQASGAAGEQKYADIVYETAEGIAKITINRPEVRNAFRPTTLFELSSAYKSEEAPEGRDAYVGKRAPDFAKFPRRP